MKHNNVSHVVGIGASAGGLEALQSLFSVIPNNLNCAYIVVQHLSPDFKSLMDELIAKHTEMAVHQATDGETLEPNCVYVIPAGKMLRVVEGKIYLSDIAPSNKVSLPINELFRSLAEDFKDRTVGVVLSGTGSDGSRGIVSIKEMGGLVISQTPDEAQFDGMPISAINTGSVDFVLDISDIPEKIQQFINHPLKATEDVDFKKHLMENQAALKDILKYFYEASDLDISAYKESVIARRLEHRLNTNNIGSLQDYYKFLQNHPEEVECVRQDLLIGVTQFFRDGEVWDSVRDEIIKPLLMKSVSDDYIRVWCAGCSTGEEPYTIAMLLLDVLDELDIKRAVKVFASDVDPSAIAVGATGIYPDSVMSEIPPKMLARYFTRLNDGSYQVSPELRGTVVFATHNLIQDPPFSNMDLVSCRNTLIYLHAETQQKTLAFFHFALKMNAYLLLGSAETTGNFANYFATIDSRLRIYQKKKDLRIPVTSLQNREVRREVPKPRSLPQFLSRALDYSKSSTSKQSKPIAFDALVEHFIPPTIVVNGNLQVIYLYGDTSPFTSKLRAGHVTNNLNEVLETDVNAPATTLIHEVLSNKSNALLEHCVQRGDEHWSMQCYLDSSNPETEDLICLSFLPSTHILEKDLVVFQPEEMDSKRLKELDTSLLEYQRRYQETLAELSSTREELQSSNEELMAANEELQSTNEELQSVNEELYTVNSEYHEKITELTDINNDLENLIKATNMAVLILGPDLSIRRFTSAMQRYVNILDFDINRDFRDLNFKVVFEGLNSHIMDVNDTGKENSQVYQHDEDRSTLVYVTPYTTGRVNRGVVVTFTEQHADD